MIKPQALAMTERQIDHAYDVFENGKKWNSALMLGVKRGASFTRTMGRRVVMNGQYMRVKNYA